jgi:hypothetical protein
MSLTDDDKNWIASAIASAIGASEARLTHKLESLPGHQDLERFATRQDLERFATRQDLERVETSLLTEFHKWASPMEQRMRTHREALRALDLETARLDERITKLEPPPQQH